MAVGLTYSVGGIRSNRDQSKTLLAEKRSPRERDCQRKTAKEKLLDANYDHNLSTKAETNFK